MAALVGQAVHLKVIKAIAVLRNTEIQAARKKSDGRNPVL